jgi:hypothetical protein
MRLKSPNLTHIVTLGLTLLIGVFSTASHAQCPPVYIFTGETAGDQFGRPVSGAGDVNCDGYADVIVGAYYNAAGGTDAGRAYVYSGQTGALLHTFTGEAAGDFFGVSVSGAGDVDDDGYADLIVGAHCNDAGGTDAGRAYVYSGQTGGLLHIFTGEAADNYFGISVSGAGDVNNDGHADLIVGAHAYGAAVNSAGRAYVYSGQTGALLHIFTGEAAGDSFGGFVSGAGDVDNDGHDDLIIGAHQNSAGGFVAGRAYVYSGQTGMLLHTFTGEDIFDQLGLSVCGAGDIDQDGYADLMVGSYEGGNGIGHAYVFSGQTGTPLHIFTGELAGDEFGWSVSGTGDVDGDGFGDLIVGAPRNSEGWLDTGRAYVYSGQTGEVLYTFVGAAAYDYFGKSVSGAGDVDNDGYADLIVGAYRNDAGGYNAGRAYVFSCPPPCICPCHADPQCDGNSDVLDVVAAVDVAFRSGLPSTDPECPNEQTDVDCSGATDVLDVVRFVNVAFRNADPGTEFCDPCEP